MIVKAGAILFGLLTLASCAAIVNPQSQGGPVMQACFAGLFAVITYLLWVHPPTRRPSAGRPHRGSPPDGGPR